MALRTKHNIREGENNDLEDVDEIDAVYIKELDKSGLSEELLTQFLKLTKQLEKGKKENKESET